ncbi:MAG: Sec-independent protein translocase protein TatB [Devosia sp.]
MFGVGWTEMLVIGVVALIVIGPKDLPVVMSRLGKAIASIRRLGSEFQRELNKTTGLDQITDLRRSITEPLKQTANEITREFNRTLSDGGTAPSGVIAPKDPSAESVVDEIQAKVGMSPAVAKPIEPPAVARHLESPAPVEAIAPDAAKPRKPRAKKAAIGTAPVPAAAAKLTAAPATEADKPRKPRAPRKPKAEA